MIEITLLLVAASIGYGLAHWLRMPSVPFLLLVGLVLGFSGLVEAQAFVQDVLVLGVMFLLFIAGTELSVRRVRQYKRVALQIGLVQFGTLTAVGLAAALALGYMVTSALYVGLALAASSTLVALRLLQRRRQMFEPFGRVTTGVLLIQDLLVVLLIPVVSGFSDGATAMLYGVGGTLLLLALAIITVRWIAPATLLQMNLDKESLLLVMLAVLFVFIGLAWLLNLPLLSAAFLAGVSLSGFPVSGIARGELQPISDFFHAVFFTSLGAVIVVPDLISLGEALIFSLIVILITPPLVILLSERAGLSARPAIENGLLLAQTSEFSLVLGLQGLAVGQISADLFTVIALTTALTMTLTPFLTHDNVVWRLMRFHPLSTRGQETPEYEDHILLLGCGESARPLMETLVLTSQKVLVVDEDPSVVDDLRADGIPCIRGDGADSFVLRAARASRARAIVSTLNRPLDIGPVFEYVQDIPVLVRVFEEAEAEKIRSLGGIPVLYSEAAAATFLEWFDREMKNKELVAEH